MIIVLTVFILWNWNLIDLDAYIRYERTTREQRITVRSKGGIHCKKKHQDGFRRVRVCAAKVI